MNEICASTFGKEKGRQCTSESFSIRAFGNPVCAAYFSRLDWGANNGVSLTRHALMQARSAGEAGKRAEPFVSPRKSKKRICLSLKYSGSSAVQPTYSVRAASFHALEALECVKGGSGCTFLAVRAYRFCCSCPNL